MKDGMPYPLQNLTFYFCKQDGLEYRT